MYSYVYTVQGNKPHPQQLPPPFSNLKIIPSLATYAVGTLAVYCC